MAKEISVTKGELKSLEVNNVWRAIVQLYTERKVILTKELLSTESVYEMKKIQGELSEVEFFLSLPDRFTEDADLPLEEEEERS